MKRPRKFYRDKELRRRVLKHREFDTFFYYYKRLGYKIIGVLSKNAKKHPLFKALSELLPLIGLTEITYDLNEVPKPEGIAFLDITAPFYVKLKAEHKMCFVKETRLYDSFVGKRTAVYNLLPELKEFIIPKVYKYYSLKMGRRQNPDAPSMNRNCIISKAAKILDEMESYDDLSWSPMGLKRDLRNKDIQKEVKKEVIDLT